MVGRDSRIDFIRGYAMITICVNHVTWLLEKAGYNESRFPTLTHYGYSSAAEIFIFMSGCMVGMVYLNKPKVNKNYAVEPSIYIYLILVCLRY